MALDVMSERAIKLTCQSVRAFILNEIPNFYFNGIDLPLMIKEYKKLHEIKHRTDNECLVFRHKKSTISKGAKKLGKVVNQ
jgi:sRNA-binding regulator protein Hfq